MKINIEVDATPQELRTFFGLPEVETLQKEVMDKMHDKMMENIDNFDAAKMMARFFPESGQSIESMQKAFWQAMMGQGESPK